MGPSHQARQPTKARTTGSPSAPGSRTNSDGPAWLLPNATARTTGRLTNRLQLSEVAHRARQNRAGPQQPASDNSVGSDRGTARARARHGQKHGGGTCTTGLRRLGLYSRPASEGSHALGLSRGPPDIRCSGSRLLLPPVQRWPPSCFLAGAAASCAPASWRATVRAGEAVCASSDIFLAGARRASPRDGYSGSLSAKVGAETSPSQNA